MLVSKGAECSAPHFIHEPTWPIKLNDLRRQAAPDAKVSGLESDLIAMLEETGGTAWFNETLVGEGRSRAVDINIARQVEAALQRGANQSLKSH